MISVHACGLNGVDVVKYLQDVVHYQLPTWPSGLPRALVYAARIQRQARSSCLLLFCCCFVSCQFVKLVIIIIILAQNKIVHFINAHYFIITMFIDAFTRPSCIVS